MDLMGRAETNRSGAADRYRAAVDPSEGPLLRRLRRGDETAFTDLVARHGGRVFALACRLVAHEDEARAVVREVFAGAAPSFGRLHPGRRIAGWLRRLTVEAALKHLRRAGSGPADPIDSWLPAFDASGSHRAPVRAWRPAPEAGEDRDTLFAFLSAAVDALPADHRVVLVLRDAENFSGGETASLLGITVEEVAARLHRARWCPDSVVALQQRPSMRPQGKARGRRCTRPYCKAEQRSHAGCSGGRL